MRTKSILALAACLLVLSFSAVSARAEKQITMTFLGDCTLGGEDRLLNKEYAFAAAMEGVGYGYYFQNVKELLKQDDLTVANLECVLRDDTSGSVNKTYVFRGLAEYTQILTLGSVEAVNLENNHTLDYGEAGKADTIRALQDAGISYFDKDYTYIYENNGIRVAFLSLSGVYWFEYHQNAEAFVEKIRLLREDRQIDAIIVSLHFGEEYSQLHSNGQVNMAHRMIDAGADLIIGHHPHVVQGMEIYQTRLILYSLGNFVFGGNSVVRSMQTIIPRITLAFSDGGEFLGVKLRIYPAHVSGDNSGVGNDNNYQPVPVKGRQAAIVYTLLERDSNKTTAPAAEAQTDLYRDYQWIYVNPR